MRFSTIAFVLAFPCLSYAQSDASADAATDASTENVVARILEEPIATNNYVHETPSIPSRGLSEPEITARSRFLQQALDAEQPAACRWWWFWSMGSIGMVVGQGVLGGVFLAQPLPQPTTDNPMPQPQWPGWIVGSIGTAVGTIPLFAPPARTCFDPPRLRSMPVATPQQRLARLHALEAALRDGVESQELGRSWIAHSVGFLLGAAQGLVLWLGFQQPWNALSSFGLTLLGAEIQIWTQPFGLPRVQNSYRNEFRWYSNSAPPNLSRRTIPLTLRVAATHNGLLIGGSF